MTKTEVWLARMLFKLIYVLWDNTSERQDSTKRSALAELMSTMKDHFDNSVLDFDVWSPEIPE